MELGTQTKENLSKKGAKGSSEDFRARDALIEQYLPFATSIANKVGRSISSDVDYEDILCSARLGLLEAARRFDGRFNVDFKTFAYYRIKGAIYDGLRKTGWVPRSLYSKIKFEQAANEYLQSVSEKSMDSIDKMSSSAEQVYDTVNSLASIYVMSLDGMEDFEVEDKAACKDMEHKVEFQKVKEKMRDAIEALPDKERKLVKMYYFQNKTLQEIGAKLNLSKSWISRMHAKALEMLFKQLNHLGAQSPAKQELSSDDLPGSFEEGEEDTSEESSEESEEDSEAG